MRFISYDEFRFLWCTDSSCLITGFGALLALAAAAAAAACLGPNILSTSRLSERMISSI